MKEKNDITYRDEERNPFSGATGWAFFLATTAWIGLCSFSWVGIIWAILALIVSLATWKSAKPENRSVHTAAIGLSIIFVLVSFIAPGIFRVIW